MIIRYTNKFILYYKMYDNIKNMERYDQIKTVILILPKKHSRENWNARQDSDYH